MKTWLLTNKKEIKQSSKSYDLFIDGNYQKLDEIQIITEGYIFPRNEAKVPFDVKNVELSIKNLYHKYGTKFIDYLKGNFVILICDKDEFHLFGDHFGIKKFFIWQKNSEFIISNDLKSISKRVELKPSNRNIAIYALTYHFTGGTTLFENVTHNMPAQQIDWHNNQLNKSTYWKPEDLLNLNKTDIPIEEISKSLSEAVQKGLDNINLDKISLSLTGGADTRNLLAIFLNKGIKPHLYTYGNPKSADCQKASAIAKGLKLEHSIHDIKMDVTTFENYAKKITRLSGGIASIHRVHRIIAVENEGEFANYMFLGTLGGEYVKGVSEDDYIVPPIVYDNWENNGLTEGDLEQYKKNKAINDIPANEVIAFLNEEPYLKGEKILRKFNSLSYITAHLHDAQDVNLYNNSMDYVFTPFLDVDYLELLFSSYYSFDNKEKMTNKFERRMDNPIYCSKFIQVTYKPLLKYKYSGEHKASEVLFNKYYAAVAKLIRQKITPVYPPNFPLGSWMEDFVENYLPKCLDYTILRETFNLEKIIDDFSTEKHIPKESYYLKYTNPIMMKFIIDEFCEVNK